MDSKPLNPDARSLEEAFFARQNAKLLERLRETGERDERRAALRAAIPNADVALIDHLEDLGLGAETVLAITLVPLALVAWADGSIDAKERKAILDAAPERGIAPGSPAHELLVSWLETKPGAELVETWRRYVRGVWEQLNESERTALRSRMLGMARGVAEAAGGFLGMGNKVSAAEQAVLDDMTATLS